MSLSSIKPQESMLNSLKKSLLLAQNSDASGELSFNSHEAMSDVLYAYSLGNTAYQQHKELWNNACGLSEDDAEYAECVKLICKLIDERE